MTGTMAPEGEERRRTPIHLWIVGIVSLLWNSMGAFDYLASQMQLDFYMSQFTEAQLEYFYAFPSWAVAGWAFGVWGAFAGSIALLLRCKWALWAFGISIIGLFVSSIYSFALSNGVEIMGTGGVIFTAVIWIVAILLLVYTCGQTKNGVLA
ncbi:MAG: hypothetical protein ABFS37_04835 [Acidobacteriota bacterium]